MFLFFQKKNANRQTDTHTDKTITVPFRLCYAARVTRGNLSVINKTKETSNLINYYYVSLDLLIKTKTKMVSTDLTKTTLYAFP